MPRQSKDTIAVLGIDIGKNTFHLVGLNKRGAIILRLKLSRRQLEARLTNLPPCLVGMEACVGAHHLSRRLKALGHDARLMPARYVRAYLKGNKNDFRDAEAIAEAVQRPAAGTTHICALATAMWAASSDFPQLERLRIHPFEIIFLPLPSRSSAFPLFAAIPHSPKPSSAAG